MQTAFFPSQGLVIVRTHNRNCSMLLGHGKFVVVPLFLSTEEDNRGFYSGLSLI